ncbi:MAG: M15 family metallopeptidase, partial [Nanoarchaeota archaeon]
MTTRRSFLKMLAGGVLLGARNQAEAATNPFVSIERYSTNRNVPILVDPVYATSRNFMGRTMPGYEAEKAWTHPEIVDDLIAVNQTLQQHGLQLLVKDAYRPIQASEAMMQWGREQEQAGKGKYVGKWVAYINRSEGKYSGHNYGRTIDVTLATLNGQEVWMGSQFDEFSLYSEFYNAHDKKMEDDKMAFAGKGYIVHPMLSPFQLREILREAMHASFIPYSALKERTAEWWHFTSKRIPKKIPYDD